MSLNSFADWNKNVKSVGIKGPITICGHGCGASSCKPSCSPSCGGSGCSSRLRMKLCFGKKAPSNVSKK